MKNTFSICKWWDIFIEKKIACMYWIYNIKNHKILKNQTVLNFFVHRVVKETASNSVASKKRQTKSGSLRGRRQSPKSFTSARRKTTASPVEASSDSDQGYLKSLKVRFKNSLKFSCLLKEANKIMHSWMATSAKKRRRPRWIRPVQIL